MSEDPPVRFPKYTSGALKTSFVDPLDTWRVSLQVYTVYTVYNIYTVCTVHHIYWGLKGNEGPTINPSQSIDLGGITYLF